MTSYLPKAPSRLLRFWRGSLSLVGAFIFPLGKFFTFGLRKLAAAERRKNGYVIILPGIEGKSYLNASMAFGLQDAGVEAAIEIYDWTTGLFPLFLYHLRGIQRNLRQADKLVQQIVDYQNEYPGRPVHLIGHSGGGALSLLTLSRLPAKNKITSAILLAPAISPAYDVQPALARTERGIGNFYSPFDWFFLALGTSIFGTVDGRHCISAGACGFQSPPEVAETGDRRSVFHQQRFSAGMVKQFHFGGHLGCTNRVFVAEEIGPLIRE